MRAIGRALSTQRRSPRQGAGHLFLQSQHVTQFSFVAAAPHGAVVRRVDQAHGEPDAASGATDGTFGNRLDAEARERSPVDGRLPGLMDMDDVREITRTPWISARLSISASVTPSAKYSWSRSAETIFQRQYGDRSRPESAAAGTGKAVQPCNQSEDHHAAERCRHHRYAVPLEEFAAAVGDALPTCAHWQILQKTVEVLANSAADA